jgi:hypothetical protein
MSYNRRGFLSRISTIFSRKTDEIFFFGLQVVINIYGEDALRQSLHRVISDGNVEESPDSKRAFYRRISALLLENLPFMEYGHWDFIKDADDATDEFESWVNELEGSIATEEEELGSEVDEFHRMSGDKSYVVVSLAFLLENAPAHEGLIELLENIPEDNYFDRTTYQKLIESLTYLDFELVLGDAAFIMPGNEQDGISFEDIHGEGWEYLKPIM